MRLSACIIAKDEERHVRRCLNSVIGVVDEIVLLDTGSTDRTVEYAKDLGAKTYSFSWEDDFSAAYNACIEHASGDWILLLDADEELLRESLGDLHDCVQSSDTIAYGLLRRDLRDASNLSVFTKMLQFRLFRNRPDLRFIGRIHHQFQNSLEEIAQREGMQVLTSSIEFNHYGYIDSNKRPKLLRAEKLMALELEDRPDQFYYLVELGRTRIALGDDSGVDLLKRAAEQAAAEDPQASASPGQLAQLLEHVLAADVLPKGFPITREEADRIAIQRFPRAIPLLWQRALAKYKCGKFGESARLLEKILHLAHTDDYDRLASFAPDIMDSDAKLNLGACYARLGKLGDALRCFDELAEDRKHGRAASVNATLIREIIDDS
ncbi:MAG: glycosyltransferase family 2 protein [Lacipirellulaceae bacterium]